MKTYKCNTCGKTITVEDNFIKPCCETHGLMEEVEAIINLKKPKYKCQKHGITENYISVTIPEYEGNYCQKCWCEFVLPNLEKLEEM